jgi:hypothetical protein
MESLATLLHGLVSLYTSKLGWSHNWIFLFTRKSTFFRKYFYLRVIMRNYVYVLVSSYLRKNLHIAFENTQYMRKNKKKLIRLSVELPLKK